MNKPLELTEREVDFLSRVKGMNRLRVADREEDKIRQKLRREGLVFFNRSFGKWEITDSGRAALEASNDQ